MAAKTKFRGSLTALVTPFKNGALDEAAFRGLVSWQIAQGSHGLVPVGTTGESPTLSHAEHHRVVEMCIDEAKGRVPVIAGAGSNSTREAVDLAVHAEKAGADAVLVVTPYYNKPTQEGMYQHFKAVNDAIGIPIIIYNIPPRSVVDMSVETMTRLFELKNIAGVKDATANLARVSQQRHAMGPDFIQLSGEDMTALAYMAAGGHGCISVVANVAPKLCAELMSAVMQGDYATGSRAGLGSPRGGNPSRCRPARRPPGPGRQPSTTRPWIVRSSSVLSSRASGNAAGWTWSTGATSSPNRGPTALAMTTAM